MTADGLTIALAHAEQGRRVFPFDLSEPDAGGRQAKIPHVRWKDSATTDEATIRRWWKRWPDALPGWRLTGNQVVVDVDDPAAFEAAGLALDVRTASQLTPRGGYHLLYEGDGREIRQTVKEVEGADTRVGDKGWVGLYDVDSFDASAKPAPEFLYDLGRPESPRTDVAEEMGTREEILRWLGDLRRARLGQEEMYGALQGAVASGRIVDLDESRPWTDKDLKALAKEAAKWEPGPDPRQTEGIMAALAAWKRRTGHAPPPPGDRRNRAEEDEETQGMFVPLSDVDPSEPQALELGYIDPEDHTILFGDGGTGKGVIAAQWAATLSSMGHTVFVLDYEAHAKYEWRPRVARFGGDLRRVFIAQPTKAIWDVALEVRDQSALLAAEMESTKAWLLVDSVAYACLGQEVESSATATRYSMAIARIGLPTLSLAHTTKADPKVQNHPFGSVFWSNGARLTIRVTGRDREPRVLENVKTNQRAPFPRVEIPWGWVDSGLPDRLEFQSAGTSERQEPKDMKGALKAVLDAIVGAMDEGITKAEIVEMTGMSEPSVEKALKVHKGYGRAQGYEQEGTRVLLWKALYEPDMPGHGPR